ncbi:MAG: cysteine synthase family protein [Bacilli bacterium]|nr:cysteine synthase family protein [Bacilli bacterium]
MNIKGLGNTKLIRLVNLEKAYALESELYAKVENTNPTGSIKDRAAYNMLVEYKKEGKLKEEGTVIEATSGNTGISLAYFSKAFNYRCIIVMPESASVQRREIIKSYGGELVLVKGGMKECNDKAASLLEEIPNSFIFSQFDNINNPLAHYKTTGPEILNDLCDVDYVFAGIGTGGTISGIGKFFKEAKPEVRIIGVEPEESPLLTKGVAGPHLIQCIGANFVPNTYLEEYVDDIVAVKGLESIEMAKQIREVESIDIGISSGASLLGAINYIKSNNIKGKKVVAIFPDKGDRYTW